MEGASFAHMCNVIQLHVPMKAKHVYILYPQFYNCNIALLVFDWDLHNTVLVGVILLCTQVELAINVEELLPCHIRRWLIVGSRKVHLNRKLSLLERMWAIKKLVCYL